VRRTMVVAVVLSLIAAGSIAPAEAGKKKKKPKRIVRTIEVAYDHPGIGVATPVGSAGYPANFPEGTSEFATSPKELFFKIEVVDASGQNVGGFVSQGDLDGNGVNDDGYGTFCGKHPEFIPVASPGTTFTGIYAYNGVCEDGSPSIMTSGTIKITFSNMP
jgi:hypothetical protein